MNPPPASGAVKDEPSEFAFESGLRLLAVPGSHLRMEGDGMGAVESGFNRLVTKASASAACSLRVRTARSRMSRLTRAWRNPICRTRQASPLAIDSGVSAASLRPGLVIVPLLLGAVVYRGTPNSNRRNGGECCVPQFVEREAFATGRLVADESVERRLSDRSALRCCEHESVRTPAGDDAQRSSSGPDAQPPLALDQAPRLMEPISSQILRSLFECGLEALPLAQAGLSGTLASCQSNGGP
jgi:hypothetical protein